MVEIGRFFDNVLYGEGDQAKVQSRMVRDGVLVGIGGQLAVTNPGGGFLNVASGEAFVQGFHYENTTTKTLAVTANLSATPRIDWVILRLDRVANTLTAVISNGIVGGGVPILTQVDGGIWEFPLAQVSTASGVSTLTDTRVINNPLNNPMTTVDDIIVANANGVPRRVAKGSNSRVFGVNAAGVLGYHEVTSAMVTDGSLVNGDLAALTIRGGVDGVAGRIAAGTINHVDLAASSASQVAMTNFSGATTSAPWVMISGTSYVQLNTLAGSLVVVIMSVDNHNSAANFARYVGHGLNTVSPSYSSTITDGTAGTWEAACVVGIYSVSAGLQTWYASFGAQSGTVTAQGRITAIEFRR